MSDFELVSPLAEAYQPVPPAPGLSGLAGAPIALVDSMLNPAAGWGQALLDGVEQTLGGGAAWRRERRKPIGGDDVEVWSDAMAAKYRAAVIAVGD